MKPINFKGLPENLTVWELIEMAKQQQELPEGFKIHFTTPKIQTAEELVDELNLEDKNKNGTEKFEG